MMSFITIISCLLILRYTVLFGSVVQTGHCNQTKSYRCMHGDVILVGKLNFVQMVLASYRLQHLVLTHQIEVFM